MKSYVASSAYVRRAADSLPKLLLLAAFMAIMATLLLMAQNPSPAQAAPLRYDAHCNTPIKLDLDGDAGDQQVSLRWYRDLERVGPWYYMVYQKSGSSGWDSGTRVTNWYKRHTVTGLTNDTEYTFRVQCVTDYGSEGAISDEVSATPTANNLPVFTDGATATRSMPDNVADGAAVGSPVSATDADGDTLTYSLVYHKADTELFRLDSETGQLSASVPSGNPDIYTNTGQSSFTVHILVSDGRSGGTREIEVTVNVTSQNQVGGGGNSGGGISHSTDYNSGDGGSGSSSGSSGDGGSGNSDWNSEPLPPLTASFVDIPASHDGTDFTFEFRLSENVEGLSFRTVRDSVITADGATITRAKRMVRGSNQRWQIHVAPDGDGDIGLSVHIGAPCGSVGIVCTADGRPISLSPATLVPGPAPATQQAQEATPAPAPEPTELTASWSPPASHDGTTFTFRLSFSEEVSLSYKNLRDVIIEASGGDVTKSRRVEKGSNQNWDITVVPYGTGDVTLALESAADCNDSGAICTSGGNRLSNALEATVPGP